MTVQQIMKRLDELTNKNPNLLNEEVKIIDSSGTRFYSFREVTSTEDLDGDERSEFEENEIIDENADCVLIWAR